MSNVNAKEGITLATADDSWRLCKTSSVRGIAYEQDDDVDKRKVELLVC